MTPFAIDGGILFFFAVGSTTELCRLHGRLGQQQQVFNAGRNARDRANGQLRTAAFHHHPPGGDDRGLALAGCDCRGPGRFFLLASSHIGSSPRHGARPRSFCFLSPVWSNLTALPSMSRKANQKIVAGHMTEYSGFKYATFFMAEYFGMFAISGISRDTFPRRLAFADRCPQLYSILSLVFPEVECAPFSFTSGWRGTLPRTSRRSNHELRLEIYASDGRSLVSSLPPSGITRAAVWQAGFGRWQ